MCLFFIVWDKESKTVVKKAPEICPRFAQGQLCMDVNNFDIDPSMKFISSKNGTMVMKTPTETSITLENVIRNYKANIEYSIIKPYYKEMKDMTPRAIYNLYTELVESRDRIYRDSPSRISTTTYTIRTTKASNRKTDLRPCDSVSSVGDRSRYTDDTDSVSDWTTQVSDSTIKPDYYPSVSEVSTSSSRRSMSYNNIKAIMMK